MEFNGIFQDLLRAIDQPFPEKQALASNGSSIPCFPHARRSVCHGGNVRTILALLLDLPLAKMAQFHNELVVCRSSDKPEKRRSKGSPTLSPGCDYLWCRSLEAECYKY